MVRTSYSTSHLIRDNLLKPNNFYQFFPQVSVLSTLHLAVFSTGLWAQPSSDSILYSPEGLADRKGSMNTQEDEQINGLLWLIPLWLWDCHSRSVARATALLQVPCTPWGYNNDSDDSISKPTQTWLQSHKTRDLCSRWSKDKPKGFFLKVFVT